MSKKNLKFDASHANKSNPNSHEFWRVRGFEKRPEDWKEIYASMNRETSSRTRSSRRAQCEFADDFGYLSVDDY